MSTNQQRLSIESQATAIDLYAHTHNFKVVQTYLDIGRSGLTLNKREGLKQLLQDVFTSTKAYRAILVYDVSRWGRFQDPDEAAHYEFVCKRVGVPVYYCAESFSNDSTLPSAIMKTLKRAMAGEYSRELSVRVDRAKRMVAEQGFRAGGAPGYGLRRMLLSSDGTYARVLEHGEIATIHDSRVTLVHGPRPEVRVVREIYRLAMYEKKSAHAIARELNRKRIGPPGKYLLWGYEPVLEILTNRKYMGDAVYGCTKQLLGSSRLRVSRDKWIVKQGAFKPIVNPEIFAAAQRVLHDRTFYRSDAELLDRLRALLKKEHRLTLHRIDTSREVPAVRTFVERFGSMKRAYDLIGCVYPKDPFNMPSVRKLMRETRRRNERLRRRLLRAICKLYRGKAVESKIDGYGRPVICFREGLRVAVVIVPYIKTPLGKLRWMVPPLRASGSHVTLLCRCNAMGDEFQDLYLVRSVDQPLRLRIKEDDAWLARGKKLSTLSHLERLALRLSGESVGGDPRTPL